MQLARAKIEQGDLPAARMLYETVLKGRDALLGLFMRTLDAKSGLAKVMHQQQELERSTWVRSGPGVMVEAEEATWPRRAERRSGSRPIWRAERSRARFFGHGRERREGGRAHKQRALG